jgi:hypothetical protein
MGIVDEVAKAVPMGRMFLSTQCYFVFELATGEC